MDPVGDQTSALYHWKIDIEFVYNHSLSKVPKKSHLPHLSLYRISETATRSTLTMKKSDALPPGALPVTPKPIQFIAVDVSRYQTPADSPVLDHSPSVASGGSAPNELQHDASSMEATSLVEEEKKPFRWVHVDPTEVRGSLRFRILPVCTPETPESSAPMYRRIAPREVTSRACPVAHEDYPTTRYSEAPTSQRVPSSGKAKAQIVKRRSEVDQKYRLVSARWSSSPDRDSDTNSRGSVETDSVSSSTDYASQLRDSEPPPQSQSPSPDAEETKFIPRRQTFFDIVLNPA